MIVAKHDLRFRLEQALYDVEAEVKALRDTDNCEGENFESLLDFRGQLITASELLKKITWIE